MSKSQSRFLKIFGIILCIVLALAIILGLTSIVFAEENDDVTEDENAYQYNTLNNDGNLKYSAFIEQNEDLIVEDYHQTFNFASYNAAGAVDVLENYEGYLGSGVKLAVGNVYELKLNVERSGLYTLSFDYYLLGSSIVDTEVSMVVNSMTQYYEAKQLVFGCDWEMAKDFKTDRYGNEILPTSTKASKWYIDQPLIDGSALHDSPMYVLLDEGDNLIKLIIKSGNVLIGDIHVKSKAKIMSYDEYLLKYQNAPKYQDDLVQLGAEFIDSKSSLDVRIYALQDANTTRYDTKHKLLNAVYGQSWDNGNQAITWKISAPKEGLYQLSFKYLQDAYLNMPISRTIMINGEVPYTDLYAYPFYYSKNWKNETLHNENGNLLVYLNEGENTITLKVNMDLYRVVIEEIDRIMDEMNNLSLEIKSLTNGQTDLYRNWNISKYIPDIVDRMNKWCDEIEDLRIYLKSFTNNNKESTTFSSLKVAIKKLNTLKEEPDQMGNRLTLFTDGSQSVSQVLGNLLLTLNNNPLGLERIYIHGDVKLPKAKEGFFVRLFEGIKRFFLSFFNNEYSVKDKNSGEVQVWVNRSRQYVEVMQQLVDEAGLKVKFSLMPDQNKLILANSSGNLPDVAVGISNWIPYDLALRGITVDLRGFAGYEELVSHFAKGAMIPYAYEDGMYGIPETQDFYVTYYRTDIYQNLGLDVPSDWTELIGQLPILQRLGYNFYSPLSSYRGLKPYVATLPFFYQWGMSKEYRNNFTGSLYALDGMTTMLSDESYVESLKFMTNLFSIYNIPEETLSFYNSFRYGTMPIGIANYGVYTSLLIAAPEINGNWSIAPHIGYNDGEETIRYATAQSQGITMFEASNNKEAAWEFIKWWMSTATQEEFIQRMYSMYGLEYLWYSANLDAFEVLPIENDHKAVILEQLRNWSMEASRVPAAYMLERSISDAYSKVVFSGVNVRIALDDAVIESNREIERKMTEFGYIKNGQKVKDYIVPSIDNIDEWLKGREEK